MIRIIFCFIILATIIEGLVLFSGVIDKNEKKEMIHPIVVITTYASTPASTPTTIQTTPKKENEELKKAVEKVLNRSDDKYGIVINNLKTGQEYVMNGDREFNPASLYKLWVMATAYKQIQKGLLDKNEVLSQDIDFLNSEFDIDPTLAELTEGGVSMTVKEALERMITQSDNYAALLLSDKLQLSSVSKFLIDNNLMNSKLGEPPVSTPNDIALFLRKLYKGDIADRDTSNEMIELLKNQQLNNKLPKLLEKETVIAHKTGELESFSHDAGIVYSDNGDYIIVIMSETDNRNRANDTIAQISKEVYDYFNNQDNK
jgi:beta-lactamase class A